MEHDDDDDDATVSQMDVDNYVATMEDAAAAASASSSQPEVHNFVPFYELRNEIEGLLPLPSLTDPVLRPIVDPSPSNLRPDPSLYHYGIVPEITNIVGSARLNCIVSLEKVLPQCLLNYEYDPRKFTAGMIRLRNPQTTTLLFRRGKLVVTGATTVEMFERAVRKVARLMWRIGYRPIVTDLKVLNVVAALDVGFPVNLPMLQSKLLTDRYLGHREIVKVHAVKPNKNSRVQYSQYEYELFPALFITIKDPDCSAVIFISGKLNVTGMREAEDVHNVVTFLFPTVYECRLVKNFDA